MADLECPYCDAENDVCHDDGAGYSEDERHEMECHACGKSFVFNTYISFSYQPKKADCLNGTPHRLEKVVHGSYGSWPDWVRCKDCDYEHRGEYRPPAGEKL